MFLYRCKILDWNILGRNQNSSFATKCVRLSRQITKNNINGFLGLSFFGCKKQSWRIFIAMVCQTISFGLRPRGKIWLSCFRKKWNATARKFNTFCTFLAFPQREDHRTIYFGSNIMKIDLFPSIPAKLKEHKKSSSKQETNFISLCCLSNFPTDF